MILLERLPLNHSCLKYIGVVQYHVISESGIGLTLPSNDSLGRDHWQCSGRQQQ